MDEVNKLIGEVEKDINPVGMTENEKIETDPFQKNI